MDIAEELRKRNIAEYLLYLWQQEDLARAYNMDIDRLERDYLSRFDVDDEELAQMRRRYETLFDRMRAEGVEAKGHLQHSDRVLAAMRDTHTRLLHSDKHSAYSESYYRALPYIVELREKSHTQQKSEIENCMEAMYGLWLLRLQGKNVNPDTAQAMKAISDLLAQLAACCKQEAEGSLEL